MKKFLRRRKKEKRHVRFEVHLRSAVLTLSQRSGGGAWRAGPLRLVCERGNKQMLTDAVPATRVGGRIHFTWNEVRETLFSIPAACIRLVQ